LNTGDLRHFVHLQRPIETEGSEGDTERDWITVRTAWIGLRALSGSEFWQASAVQANVQYRAICRAPDVEDLDTSWRIKTEDGRILNVMGKLHDDRDRAATVLMLGENTTDPKP